MSTVIEKLYPLIKTNLVLLLFFLIFGGLYFGSAFFIPLTFAAVLAMLMTPLCEKLEAKGVNRVLATFICVMLLLALLIGLGAILSAQISSFSDNIPQIEQRINQTIYEAQIFVSETFGISPERQEEMIKGGPSSESGGVGAAISGFLSSFTGILANSLLTLVYLFMLLYYRRRFAKFILKVVREDQRERAQHVIDDSAKVAQQYLVGRILLIAFLGLMYSIGFSLVGLDNAILFALVAALFSIIPYVGNVIGITLPLIMALTQDGGGLVIWIIVVFSIVQFVESYILEPYVVGGEVDIHPFFTVVIIIIGELIWGIAGMILAIPLLGIVKIIFTNLEEMQPYAYLIGDTTDNGKGSKIGNTVRGWFSGGQE